MADKKMTQLAEPEAAIASYLDDLLHTATSTALAEETKTPQATRSETATETKADVQTETRVAPRRSRVRLARKPKPQPEAQVVDAPPAVTEKAPAREETQTPESSVPQPATAPDTPDPAQPAGRPDWSEEPFECLIFTVSGLKLAVPLVLLGAIHKLERDDEIRPIPGSPRWYMGMRPDRDHNLRVVDSAEWIMAGRVPEGARENYHFVIRLDDSEWGLACDDVAQSFTLHPDEVRWRTGQSKRPWLAGTVVDHMCALIDVRAMAKLLARAEREQHLDLS